MGSMGGGGEMGSRGSVLICADPVNRSRPDLIVTEPNNTSSCHLDEVWILFLLFCSQASCQLPFKLGHETMKISLVCDQSICLPCHYSPMFLAAVELSSGPRTIHSINIKKFKRTIRR